jgi:hypothetical protein
LISAKPLKVWPSSRTTACSVKSRARASGVVRVLGGEIGGDGFEKIDRHTVPPRCCGMVGSLCRDANDQLGMAAVVPPFGGTQIEHARLCHANDNRSAAVTVQCRVCWHPLPARDGEHILKYFLVSRGAAPTKKEAPPASGARGVRLRDPAPIVGLDEGPMTPAGQSTRKSR